MMPKNGVMVGRRRCFHLDEDGRQCAITAYAKDKIWYCKRHAHLFHDAKEVERRIQASIDQDKPQLRPKEPLKETFDMIQKGIIRVEKGELAPEVMNSMCQGANTLVKMYEMEFRRQELVIQKRMAYAKIRKMGYKYGVIETKGDPTKPAATPDIHGAMKLFNELQKKLAYEESQPEENEGQGSPGDLHEEPGVPEPGVADGEPTASHAEARPDESL